MRIKDIGGIYIKAPGKNGQLDNIKDIFDIHKQKRIMENFTIDQVSWHTKRSRNFEFDTTIVYRYFRSIINYLEGNKLTNGPILDLGEEITEGTKIHSTNMTEEGMRFMRVVYDKWLEKVSDGKIQPEDHKMLDRALKKIRTLK